jgi:hypothetical protein
MRFGNHDYYIVTGMGFFMKQETYFNLVCQNSDINKKKAILLIGTIHFYLFEKPF